MDGERERERERERGYEGVREEIKAALYGYIRLDTAYLDICSLSDWPWDGDAWPALRSVKGVSYGKLRLISLSQNTYVV
jgi:hypothetical protein